MATIRSVSSVAEVMMFQHILVPVDFSAKNQAALTIALELAKQNRSKVALLHVIETIDYAAGPDIDQFYDMLEDKAEAQLETLAEPFVEAGIVVDRNILFGKRVPGILQFTVEHHVDLVVLSSHKIDLASPAAGLGALSYQATLLCQCPVLLVK